MFALQDLRIIDLTQYAPGSYCTMILADEGAEVIKIEALDDGRVATTRWGASGTEEQKRKEAALDAVNRNKKSLRVNLKSKDGQEVIHRLARVSDVVVEGFRPGVVKRLGVDYETIARINQQVIYCSLSGFGQTGPYVDLPGHDINYISVGGALGLVGQKDRPVVPLSLVGDMAGAGLHGAIGILMALVARSKTGRGQYIDIAYADTVAHLMTYFAQFAFAGKGLKRGCGYLGGDYPYYRSYATKDGGHVTIGCLESWFWENLCRALGKEEYIPFGMSKEHMYQEPQDQKWQEISRDLENVFLTRTRQEWFDFLSKKNVPIAPVYNLEEVPSDPQMAHREMFVDIQDPVAGKVRQVGSPFKFSETPGKVRCLAPVPGQHTDEVLAQLGYSSQQIAGLRQAKVVG